MADGVYFEATSLIDGKPLVIVLRGRDAARKEKDDGANDKTGAMIQSYIMPRDESPTDAARSGADVSVCGDCPHRPILARESGAARCYVNLGHGPRVVYDAVRRGAYQRVNLLGACAYVAGLPTRFGSWGDPGAIDAQIWHALSMHASERTGYTHRWRDTGAALRGIVMASVDSEAERDEARGPLGDVRSRRYRRMGSRQRRGAMSRVGGSRQASHVQNLPAEVQRRRPLDCNHGPCPRRGRPQSGPKGSITCASRR